MAQTPVSFLTLEKMCIRDSSHLGAGAGLAGDGLDLDGTVVDLGNFQLEHPLDQAGMGTADGHAGAALGGNDVHHVNLQDVALGVVLTGNLLVAGQDLSLIHI